MAKLSLRGVVKQFGNNTVCNGIDLDVDEGQMVCLIGASGAGKSTLLRCINLLEAVEDGEIFLDGEDIAEPGLNPQGVRARIGMVFQSFNLFPHMTAFENAMLAPRRVHGRSKADLVGEVEELFKRAAARDAAISVATVYRTVKLFEEANILDKLEFGDGRARYETADRDHHDHLIDMNSGAVIEFIDPEIEALQEKIAAKLGYQLRGHRLELYGVPLKSGDQ